MGARGHAGPPDPAETPRLKPPDGGGGDAFGYSVALSGDTALIWAPEHSGRGTAYAFTRSGANWDEQQKLVPRGRVQQEFASEWFGCSVDYAVNVEPTRGTSVQIDTRPPTKTQAFPARAVTGGQVKLRYRVEDPLPGSGKAKVTVSFLVSGHSVKWIRIPGTPASNVTNTYTWRCALPRGTYDILVTADDLAGNVQKFFSAYTARLTVR